MHVVSMFNDREMNLRFTEFMLSARPPTVSEQSYSAFSLYYRDGKTQREIATSLGVPFSRARDLIFRAEYDGSIVFSRGVCPCCHGTGLKPKDDVVD